MKTLLRFFLYKKEKCSMCWSKTCNFLVA